MAEVRIGARTHFTAYAVGLPGNAHVSADSARSDRYIVKLEWGNDPTLRETMHFSIAEAKAIGQALMEVAGAIGAQLAPGQVEGEYHAGPVGEAV